jgi:hypothetical protein
MNHENSKRTQGNRLRRFGLLVASAALVASRVAAADLDPTRLLIEAANRGRDDPAIQSGSGEVDETAEIAPGTTDEFIQRIEHDVAKLRAHSQQWDPRQRAAAQETIASATSATRESIGRTRIHRSHWRVVFSGSQPAGRLRREVHAPPNAPLSLVTLGEREKSGGFVTLRQTNTQRVEISAEPFWDMPWFPDFGREIADRGSFVSQGESQVEKTSSRLLKQETVDGHELSVLESTSSGGSKRTFWIDPARGYVCPRSESYDAAGRLVRTQEASGFFLDAASGIWFAEHQVKTDFNPETAKQTRRTDWHLHPKSVKINYPVSDKEFSLPILASTLVHDQRTGGRDWRATQDTVLALVDGSLDLGSTPGLSRIGLPQTPWEDLPKTFSTLVKCIVTAVAVGVAALLIGLVWLLKFLVTRTRLVE